MAQVDQITQEAQDRLLQKRELRNLTGSHGQQTESINFQEIADRCIKKAKEEGRETPVFISEFKDEIVKTENKPTIRPIHGLPKAYAECSFDNYMGNDKLISDLQKLTAMDFDGIVLRGNTGCGKTHLAISAGKKISTEFKADGWDMIPGTIFITTPELLLKIRSSFQDGAGKTEEGLIDYYSGCGLLILDDLGSEKTSEFAVTTLYIILDRRLRDCRKTIITTNLSKEEIEKTFGARIASRLSGMENIKINMPDYRKKRD